MSKYTMKKLKQDYGNFVRPKITIKIANQELNSKYTKESVVVEIPSTYDAAICKFTITNAFDHSKDYQVEIEKDLKDVFQLGNLVEVFMGYESGSEKQVFFGYIDAIYFDYDEEIGIEYSVECLDAKGIMMNSYRSTVKKNAKKYSDAVADVLKKYSKLIKKKQISTTSEIETIIEQHNESDYQFVVRLAKKLNYCFYIVNGEAYFQEMGKDTEDFFTFCINEGVRTFSMFQTLKKQVSSVTVRGNNEKDPTKPFESTASAYKSIADNSKVQANKISIIDSNVTKTIIDNSISSENEAKQRAEAELNELSYKNSKGTISTVGIPDFVPNKVVSVEGFGKQYDKKYRIVKVTHKYKNYQYTTECELEANK